MASPISISLIFSPHIPLLATSSHLQNSYSMSLTFYMGLGLSPDLPAVSTIGSCSASPHPRLYLVSSPTSKPIFSSWLHMTYCLLIIICTDYVTSFPKCCYHFLAFVPCTSPPWSSRQRGALNKCTLLLLLSLLLLLILSKFKDDDENNDEANERRAICI